MFATMSSESEISDGGSNVEQAMELVDLRGFIRHQILYAAVAIGLFDTLDEEYTSVDDVAESMDLDPSHLYRLLRAMTVYGVVSEDEHRGFALTPVGACFQSNHPNSVAGSVGFFFHPDHLAVWSHLPDIVEEGGPNGFVREYGHDPWTHLAENDTLGEAFNELQTQNSLRESPQVLNALASYDFSRFDEVCDVGGGHGHLLASLLEAHPHLEGRVLEVPEVVAETEQHWAPEMEVDERCEYLAGDMFDSVPPADGYVLKHILHGWDDDDCVTVLSNVRDAAPPTGRVFVAENVVPPPGVPHWAKPGDINIMTATSDRERTKEEYAELFERAGWRVVAVHEPDEGSLSVIEGAKR